MKKVVLFFGIAAAFALASCGGNSGNTETTSAPVDTVVVDTPAPVDTIPAPADSIPAPAVNQ